MIEGESGILAVSPPWFRPIWKPGLRRLLWPNGAVGRVYTAEKPDKLRGPQHDRAWADELAAWRYPETWDNLLFGLRLGPRPQAIVTTTPRPTKLVRELIADPGTVITRGKTSDNRANLPSSFLRAIQNKYGGTRLGRQELDGDLLEDVPGALWKRAQLDELRLRILGPDGRRIATPAMRSIVVAVDPPSSDPLKADDADRERLAECGIVVVGLGHDDKAYILDDLSGQYSPSEWASKVAQAFHNHQADWVVAEVNQGGALVEVNLRTVDEHLPIRTVHASRGKRTRAEPVSGLYEQRKVHHVGLFPELEDQMCTWDAGLGEKSPDRMDALVWGVTFLMLAANTPGDYESFRAKR